MPYLGQTLKFLEFEGLSDIARREAKYIMACSQLQVAATKVDEADKEERDELVQEALESLEGSLEVTKDPFVIYSLILLYSKGLTHNRHKIPGFELNQDNVYTLLGLTKDIRESLLTERGTKNIYAILNINLMNAIVEGKIAGSPDDVLKSIRHAFISLDSGILNILTSEGTKGRLSKYFSEYTDELAEFERYQRFAEQAQKELTQHRSSVISGASSGVGAAGAGVPRTIVENPLDELDLVDVERINPKNDNVTRYLMQAYYLGRVIEGRRHASEVD